MNRAALAAGRRIDSRILFLRGPENYSRRGLGRTLWVEVKHLNQQIKCNRKRFPGDFLFRISAREFEILRSQIVTTARGTSKLLEVNLPFHRHRHRVPPAQTQRRNPPAHAPPDTL